MSDLPIYRVSTITCVGDLNTCLDLSRLFSEFHLNGPDSSKAGNGAVSFLSAKIGDSKRSWIDSAVSNVSHNNNDKDPLSDNVSCAMSKRIPNCFGNQVTFVMEMEGTRINLKAFKNGRLQLTGVKNVDQGFRAIQHFAKALSLASSDGVLFPEKMCAGGYKVCLINSDFSLGFPVKRDRLFTFVRETYPEMLCTYEPCNYHGVKFKYMWNARRDEDTPPGICRCADTLCTGKGDGSDIGKCRKVTIAVFQSGKVIATGAHTIQQLEDAIRFLVTDVCAIDNRGWYSMPSVKECCV